MNKVRAEGVVFTAAIVAGPKCAPSRFNVLTGRYCSRSYQAHSKGGAAENGNATRTSVDVPTCKLIDADLTSNLQTDMAAGGYETIMSGKWHLSTGSYASPYTEAEADVADAGFSNAASIYVTNMDAEGLTTFGHNLEWVTAKAIEGIDSAFESSKPFFLYFTPTNPWGQNQGMNTESLEDFTVRDTPSGTLAADPVSGMPARSTVLERAPACSGRKCAAGELDDGWVGTIAVDDSLGSLMAHLKAKGELDNTLIIVTQDHGQTAKESLYQGGVRVSLFARYPPAIRAGLVVNTPVVNVDVAPTILEFAGLTASFGIDGVSWWGAAASAQTPSASLLGRECLISEMNYDRIVVCGSMKYLSNWDDSKDAKASITKNFPAHADAEQIYNLASDPTEQTNLVSGGTQEAFRAKAIAILKKHDADTATASTGSLATGSTTNPTTTSMTATTVPTATTTTVPTATATTTTTTNPTTTTTITITTTLKPATTTEEITVTSTAASSTAASSTAASSTATQSTHTVAKTKTSSPTKIPPTTTTRESTTRSASSSSSFSSSSSTKLKAASTTRESTTAPKEDEASDADREEGVPTKPPSIATTTSTARALTASAVVGRVDADAEGIANVEGMLAAALVQTKTSGPANGATIDSLVALILRDSDAATKAMVDAIETEADPAVSGALYDQIKKALVSTASSVQDFGDFFQQADAAIAAKSAEPDDAEGTAPKTYGGAIAGAIVAVIVAVIVAYAVVKHREKQDVDVAAPSSPPVYQNPAFSSGAAPENGIGHSAPATKWILEDATDTVGAGGAAFQTRGGAVDYRNPAEFLTSANGLERGNSMC